MDQSLHELSAGYVLHALSAEEAAAFEAHLPECPACAAETADLRAVTARLGSAVAVDPPPAMKASVLARIDALTAAQAPEPDTPSGGPIVALRSRRLTLGARLTAAAAAVLLVAVGLLGVQLSRTADERDRLRASSDLVTRVLTAEDARRLAGAVAGGGRGAVVTSRDVGASVFVGSELTRPADGRVFQLWLIDASGTATSAGVFLPDRAGAVSRPLPADLGGAAAVGLSVEPEGGSSAPTTTPVLALPLS